MRRKIHAGLSELILMANNISFTSDNDLCTGCGICSGTCNKHAITMKVEKGNFRPVIDKNTCNGCGLCLKACPGVGINLVGIAERIFTDAEQKEHDLLGRYLSCYTGYSSNEELRTKAASGGVISQLLIWLLDSGYIDGALVTCFNNNEPLKVKSFIATTREEIVSAMGSKYAPVSYGEAVNQIKKFIGSRIVVVGLPCHIHGFRKLMDINKDVREKVIGLFSLFCSGSQSFNYSTYILSNAGLKIDNLQYLAYREGHPSGMVARTAEKEFFKEYKKYNLPLKATFYPRRCLLCVDMFGELADVNFGDIHCEITQEAGTGINAIITRSRKWQEVLLEAERTGAISLSEISVERMLNKRPMASAKKTRNASFIKLLKTMHFVHPVYDSRYGATLNAMIVMRYLFMRTKQIIGANPSLWFLLPKIK